MILIYEDLHYLVNWSYLVNSGYPSAKPIGDVITILLSFLSMGMKKYFKL